MPETPARDTSLPDLTGRVALVTGASGLVGGGIAERFAAAGAAVVVHFREDEKGAHALATGIVERGGKALPVQADLTRESECERLVETAADWQGGLDALVNNAGIQPVQGLAETTADDWRKLYDANTTSAFSCTRAAAPLLAARGGGSITHIASIEGTMATPGHAHYCASKAALIMFARSAALEYGPDAVRVNTVSPGLIDRPGLADDWPDGVRRWTGTAPLGRLGSPADIGNACVFLASDAAAWISGTNLVVDGGVSAAPTW
ncbi:glucose 1-dehydrogenase [Streptomyces spiroverticillatus]|uniref:Glucose 1-dehydrogenase n=1 Tax=Streptomyces finlayi TaxID=67296 RepID=A0A918X9J1_9ACTN|nr:SDR family NAD(P)-dependent oxidoreductase [Streptomyces finlayi]GHA48615.1 glucose 1-dehydrogenase [Streptomyces spiroverticillatus]GHD18989.1 glucose 1-dehydrogenase [Streptomyces finlayi]